MKTSYTDNIWKASKLIQEQQKRTITNKFFELFASVPVMAFIGMTIGAVWGFGLEIVFAHLILNLFFIGMPIVLFIRWMMKRQSNNQNF